MCWSNIQLVKAFSFYFGLLADDLSVFTKLINAL